jgi:hypothetical protein
MSHPEKDWLDYNRAVQYIHDRVPGGYNRRALERAKSEGLVAFTKISGRIWFKKPDLDSFITQLLVTKKAVAS